MAFTKMMDLVDHHCDIMGEYGLKIEPQANLKVVDYMDINLVLNT